MAKHYSPEERRADIISAAVGLTNDRGFTHLTPSTVIKGCLLPTTKRNFTHFFTMKNLRSVVAHDERLNEKRREQARSLGLLK